MSDTSLRVTAADVESAVRLTVATLGEAQHVDWEAKAGTLEWTCWEIVETLVHMHDVAEGLGVGWAPPADLCGRLLARFCPDAPTDTESHAVALGALTASTSHRGGE
jgi:hypothetical protein